MTRSHHPGTGDALNRILAVVSTRRPNGGVEVTGEWELAQELRLALATATVKTRSHHGEPGTAPACIVDTTGRPEVIAQALTRLADLGLLVLAGPPPAALSLDLYSDVHVRGLRLVGVEAVCASDPTQLSG